MHSVLLSNKRLREIIPQRSGVYFFRNAHGTPVYIGKANNLQARIIQHLSDTKNPKEIKIRDASHSIDWRETNSEFEALLFEANCVKKYQPHYNVELKDDKSSVYIVISKEDLPRIHIIRETHFTPQTVGYYFGPLHSTCMARMLISLLRRTVPFCTSAQKRPVPCFYRHLHQCNPCPGEIVACIDEYKRKKMSMQYKKNVLRLKRILSGNGNRVLVQMKKEMEKLSHSEAYEEAGQVRDRISQLELLFQRRLIVDERLEDPLFLQHERMKELQALQKLLNMPAIKRIECFDVSTFSAKQSVASCVVFINGIAQTNLYKRFRIRGKSDFDPEMLREVLLRRLAHSEWELPQIIVLDGGSPQLRAVVPAVKRAFPNAPEIISIAKRPDRLIHGSTFQEYRLEENTYALHLIQRLRDEAHRFAKKYHVSLRKKVLFS